MPAIRRLGSGDLPAMRALNAVFGRAFDDAQAYGGAPPDAPYLAGLLAKDHVVALVAMEGGTVLGGLVAYELEKFEQARSEFYLYDLAVAEEHRRRGLATALIAALRKHAATRGGSVVFVQADHGDDPAIALYTGLGLREDVMHFDIPVTPAPRFPLEE